MARPPPQVGPLGPYRLQNEAGYLEDLGVNGPLTRIFMDLEAFVITPYHILINQLMEKQRGNGKHGSCGMGIGITAMEAFDHLHFYTKSEDPIHCLQVKEWLNPTNLTEKLQLISTQKLFQANAIIHETTNEETRETLKNHLENFLQEFSVEKLVTDYKDFVSKIGESHLVEGKKFLRSFLEKSQNVIFEGAQGALLDTDFGFFPYVTATCCTPKNALTLLDECSVEHKCLQIGALRSYSHRHGAGPFTTENTDPKFLAQVPEQHNGNNLWQGAFRVGPLDIVALKYGLTLSKVDAISLTHMDYLPENGDWELVLTYKYGDPSVSIDELSKFFECEKKGADIIINSIKPHKLSTPLTTHLALCSPHEVVNLRKFLDEKNTDVAKALVDFIFQHANINVHILSYGPSSKDKKFIR
eukprot:Phypoly_transcript_08407.p1 GENE.Phypoly_transcript_08407~~Phypoly_transcript_08407.p1  ORF type:complete len:414 (+),score=54.15 Phypoly_transcript_08407:227-1468(+)